MTWHALKDNQEDWWGILETLRLENNFIYCIQNLYGEGPSVIESMVATSAHVIEDLLKSQNPMDDLLNDALD